MPTYEYRCPKCGHHFEQFQKITAKPVARCPKCGARAERLLSAAGLVFKGSGFYITDYKRAGEKKEKDHGGDKKEKDGGGEKPARPETSKPTETARPRKKKDA